MVTEEKYLTLDTKKIENIFVECIDNNNILIITAHFSHLLYLSVDFLLQDTY